jgi:hypothetical protein
MRFASRCKEVRSKSFGGAAVFFSFTREVQTARDASQVVFNASASALSEIRSLAASAPDKADYTMREPPL